MNPTLLYVVSIFLVSASALNPVSQSSSPLSDSLSLSHIQRRSPQPPRLQAYRLWNQAAQETTLAMSNFKISARTLQESIKLFLAQQEKIERFGGLSETERMVKHDETPSVQEIRLRSDLEKMIDAKQKLDYAREVQSKALEAKNAVSKGNHATAPSSPALSSIPEEPVKKSAFEITSVKDI
ncbi:hypothetical protein O5D80_002161 [Batrachochytrium dendrobatidis]|nr:hypothetical protein O5D80_002161 [Batrachochytrium dendrobatidis]